MPAQGPSRPATKTWLTALILGLASFLLFLAGIAYPNFPIFDEIQYLDSSRALLAGTTNLNPEAPPFGKLIIAGGITILGDNPWGWRVPGAVFGAVTLVGVFLFLVVLLDDYALALAGAMIALLNNFLYVLARTAMMDIYLVAFMMWGILAFTAALKLERLSLGRRRLLLLFSGLFFGLACASKWNAADALCVVVGIGVVLFFWPRRSSNPEILGYSSLLREAKLSWFLFSFTLVPLLAYAATFWPLCRSQRLPFSVNELISMNAFIWRFHNAIHGNDAIITPWYSWPLATKPMRSLSYLIGNWYVMWGGLVALLFCLRRFAHSLPETMIVLLYLVNWLQWAVTPQRCLYYYYYFPAAMFLGMAIPVALHRLPAHSLGVRLSVISVLPALCVFAYCIVHMANLPAPYDCMLGCWP